MFWFKRDLRTRDNRALYEAASRASELIPVFVIDEEILGKLRIDKGDERLNFLCDALRHLSKEIRLYVFYGRTCEVFEQLLDRHKVDAVFTAKPLTWDGEERCAEVEALCKESGVKYVSVRDNLLVDVGSIAGGGNFSSFYRRWLRMVDDRILPEFRVDKVPSLDEPGFEEACRRVGAEPPKFWSVRGCLERLEGFDFGSYARFRDFPGVDGSSRLSPAIRLGVVSIREVYRVSKGSPEFVRQLAWREYYYFLKEKFPWMKDLELKYWMRGIEWENDPSLVKAFMEGRTGYPIVDAGVRQLKTEKWVHNRVRLILASFLAKDLLVDWRVGERFFREHLIDYDQVLNVGNWQWASSVGVDPLYLRVFNPISQSRRYDPDCRYVRKYLPELEGLSCEAVHDPLKWRIEGYCEPVVDHYQRVKRFKELASRRKR
ncbi:MAG: DNA photolyase family protein [Thermofilaceae archaeon]|nr:DNA photolyase family protein [Thermofilaceae archaeon]